MTPTRLGDEGAPVDVVITGTGVPRPSRHRAGPGVFVRVGSLGLQFDAGRATTLRLAELDVSCADVSAVFLTHHHSDHLIGLPDLVLTRWLMGSDTDGPCPVIAPRGPSADFASRMMALWDDDVASRREHSNRRSVPGAEVKEFDVPEAPALVWEGPGVRVLSLRVRHPPIDSAVGYRVETPSGVVAISGDTRKCPEVERLAEKADVLVHEAVSHEWVRARGRDHLTRSHTDPAEVGEVARNADVGTVILTHLIPAPRTAADTDRFVGPVREAGFPGRVIVAEDLTKVRLADARAVTSCAPVRE